MFDFTARTALLIGDDSMEKLKNSTVMIIGLGGVGGAAAEAIARSGVGTIILVDHDNVDITNINRQLFTTHDNIGESKSDIAKKRLLSINPEANIISFDKFYNADTSDEMLSLNPDFVIDAIDTVSSKLYLAVECKNKNIPLIQSMGTGNRLDPCKFQLGTIEETAGCGCGLARVMRRELKARGIKNQPVLFSTEIPRQVVASSDNGRHSPASICFCPPVAGYIIASYVIKKLIGQ